jgi:hypothetical protein
MRKEAGAYYFLPAVYRYLDHFEALAATVNDDFGLDEANAANEEDSEEPHGY